MFIWSARGLPGMQLGRHVAAYDPAQHHLHGADAAPRGASSGRQAPGPAAMTPSVQRLSEASALQAPSRTSGYGAALAAPRTQQLSANWLLLLLHSPCKPNCCSSWGHCTTHVHRTIQDMTFMKNSKQASPSDGSLTAGPMKRLQRQGYVHPVHGP